MIDLSSFTGSENWYRHALCRHITYTDGVKYLAEKANCYWLIDKVATLQMLPAVKREYLQRWKLCVTGTKARLSCEGDGGEVYAEDIDYTDFPQPEITIWFTNNVILLPSEY